MFRLLTRSALVLLLLTGVSTVGAMLIGRLRPAPTPHLVVTEPRLDQWTAVKLLSLDDNVAVERYLPIRIHGMTWQSDGDNLDVLGMRNQTQRMYKINYEAHNSRIQWKAAINAHSNLQRLVSPDFEWELVPVADTENAQDLQFHVIPYVDGGTPDFEPVTYTRQWRIVNTIWSRHSDWVIYSKISNQVSNGLMHYYLYDIATQSEIMLSDSAITFPAISQDQTKIMYSQLRNRNHPLPSPDPADYALEQSMYLYDLKTQSRQLIHTAEGTSHQWSPDSRWLVFLDAVPKTPVVDVKWRRPDYADMQKIVMRYPPGTVYYGMPSQQEFNYRIGFYDTENSQLHFLPETFSYIQELRWYQNSRGIFFQEQRPNFFQPLMSWLASKNILTPIYLPDQLINYTVSTETLNVERLIAPENQRLNIVANGIAPNADKVVMVDSMPMPTFVPNYMYSTALNQPITAYILSTPYQVQAAPVYLLDVASQAIKQYSFEDEERISQISFSPAGDKVLFFTIAPLPIPPLVHPTATAMAATAQAAATAVSSGNVTASYMPMYQIQYVHRLYWAETDDTALNLLAESDNYINPTWIGDGKSLLYPVMDFSSWNRHTVYYTVDLNALDQPPRAISQHFTGMYNSNMQVLQRPVKPSP